MNILTTKQAREVWAWLYKLEQVQKENAEKKRKEAK